MLLFSKYRIGDNVKYIGPPFDVKSLDGIPGIGYGMIGRISDIYQHNEAVIIWPKGVALANFLYEESWLVEIVKPSYGFYTPGRP